MIVLIENMIVLIEFFFSSYMPLLIEETLSYIA
jgi:hypothetical protein